MALWQSFYMRLFGFLAMFMLALFPGGNAFAEVKVSARTGGHADYTRLVLEWPEKPSYTLSREGGRILVRFGKAATLDSAGVSTGPVLQKIETLSSGTEPLQLAISVPPENRFRDFIVENRLVIDIYHEKGRSPPEKAPQAASEARVKPAVPAYSEPAKQKKPEERNLPETPGAKTDFSVSPAAPETPAPASAVEEGETIASPALGDHQITFTNTFSMGLAAYVRGGDLFIVTDVAEAPDPPALSGPRADTFAKPERIDAEGGAAWRFALPEGMKAFGEGGGLSWSIILSQQDRPVSPALPQADGASGEIVFPLANMRKIVTLTDPVVGDVVQVVTAGRAASLAGPARDYPQLQTLPSAIGLAFVAKADGVRATLNTQQVRIGREGGGLAVSATSDLPPPQDIIQPPLDSVDEQMPEKEPSPQVPDKEPPQSDAPQVTGEQLSRAADEKPAGNNVYNFPRWEMGGLKALTGNMHVMMTEMSGKDGGAQEEDIITMAKMNLANGRGAEALGLLRVALQKVPELSDNAEFKALRGLAFALSHKFDEAIIDFSDESVRAFDDAKIWRVYTLAGLEDWGQAIAEFPADIAPVASYPAPLRRPLSLSLAEVALRGGKVPLAQGILKSMEAELPSMILPHAAAWKYLSGEAQRQAGKSAQAEALWIPLVKNGKDDLYRAKAGLSLTRLQLDENRIKPADAIDRLEGLRYAWRGDELETLINYRLGEVYIKNKDYLKGLTVLRNASTLSPGTAIGDQVQKFMAGSFRDVFAKDLLKDVSPLEAISLYEEFKDLTPPGPEGDAFVEKLAERLVEAELLGRASTLLEGHVNNRLKGPRKAEIAIRLAAIRLLDGNPAGALRSLEVAQSVLDAPQTATPSATPAPTSVPATDPEKQRQINLLKARALSMQKKTDEALAILEAMRPDPDVNRLKTDIAWKAGKWEEAAAALNDLIVAEDISARLPLNEYQREIIFNRAIALNLSGNRVALANLRERYNAQMGDTPRGKMFEIVTRPRRPDMIGSREAIQSMMSEIDLFQRFLDGYAKMNAPQEDVKADVKTDITAPPAASPAASASTQ